MTQTDEQLMQRYRDGDGGAFDELYQRHRGAVFRYIKRLCRDGTDVEAVFQDTWMRVIHHRDLWHADQPFSPWLFRIAHNRVIDLWRSEGRRVVDDEAIPDTLPDQGLAHDAMQLLHDCVQRLKVLLSALPEVQRSAFLLKEEAGLSLAQIGEVTGVERETVKSRLRYAMQRLRSGLEGCDE